MTKKIVFRLSFSILLVIIINLLLFFTCSNNNLLQSDNDGTTKLQVRIHDEPFKCSGKTVSELNITVIKVDIIRANSGEVVNCPITQEKELNILEISKSNPVVLSDVSVPSGDYEQLRLVIKNNATITVDDETFDIKIPSGEQSGVKLDGNFSIRGKFFRLDLDFIPEESVIYNKGQGYILKPVIKISDIEDRDILGYFRGNIDYGSGVTDCEAVIDLGRTDFRLKTSDNADYTLSGSYSYNSFVKTLFLENIDIEGPGIDEWTKPFVKKEVPSSITIPIKEWSLNEVITIAQGGIENKLYRVSNFDFSDSITFTDMTIDVIYPDDSKSGKIVILEVKFVENGMPPKYFPNVLIGNSFSQKISISDSFIMGDDTLLEINCYLLNNQNDANLKIKTFANRATLMPTDMKFSESNYNPWSNKKKYKLIKSDNNHFIVNFQKRLNIKITPTDFSVNNPEISWDAYPCADNGYLVFAMIKDRQDNINNDDNDGNNTWDIIFMEQTNENKIKLYSESILFNSVYNSEFTTPPNINSGDILRIEVYVLDKSDNLNTNNKTGAIFMDSLNIIR